MPEALRSCAEMARALADAISSVSGGLYIAELESVDGCIARISVYNAGCEDCGIDDLHLALMLASRRIKVKARLAHEAKEDDDRRVIVVELRLA